LISRRTLIKGAAAAAGALTLSPVWAEPADRVFRVGYIDHRDSHTQLQGTEAWLKMGGLEPVPLDPNRPADQQNLDAIVLGSFSSETEIYRAFMQKHVGSIRRGGVVLQFAQADQAEASPPFLFQNQRAQRTAADPEGLIAVRTIHPLMNGLFERGPAPHRMPLAAHLQRRTWGSFKHFRGFAVLAAENKQRHNAVILEAPSRRGRLLLTSLHFDRLIDRQGKLACSPDFAAQTERLAQNFRNYIARATSKQPLHVKVDPEYPQGEPVAFKDGAWTLAVLPDTQKYSASWPHHFINQTQWIADQANALNIQHVLHLGDLVNRGYIAPYQWAAPDRAFAVLDGRVPYGMVPGNHDYNDDIGRASRETHLNKLFPAKRIAAGKTLKEVRRPGFIDDSVMAFQVGGQKWMMLGLEFGPRDEVLQWAAQMLKKYHDHHVIVYTHAYLFSDGTRYDSATKRQAFNPMNYNLAGGANDGEMMWQKVFRKAPNVRMVLCGHMLGDGQGYLASQADAGHTVHQMLQNYQMKHEGGEGYLRLFQFYPDGKTVQAISYSPSLDLFLTDAANQFDFTL